MTSTTLSKRHQITNDLRRVIADGELQVGDPLPTHNQLIDRYGVALGTVRMAMMQLQNEGLVWSCRGKGTFVADPAKRRVRAGARKGTIGLILELDSNAPGFASHAIGFQSAVEAQGFDVVIRWCKSGDDFDAEIQRMGDLAGLVVWGAPTSEQLDRWTQGGIPVVLVGVSWDGQIPASVSHVDCDLKGMIEPLAELVFGMGHRKVTLLLIQHSAYFDQLAGYFLQAARAFGLEDQCRVFYIPGDSAEEDQFIRELTQASDPPTALLIENDFRACRIINALQAMGRRVPQDISVAAAGMLDPEHLAVPNLSRMYTSLDDIIAQALNALNELIQTGRVVRCHAPQRLRVGQTCQPVVSPSSSV